MKPVLALSVVALLSGPAFAQTAYVEADDRSMVTALGIDADRLEDLDIFDAAGTRIGDVDEVVGATRDVAEAIVVDFEGDRSEYGREDRIVPLDQFSLQGDILTFNGDAASMANLPVWDD